MGSGKAAWLEGVTMCQAGKVYRAAAERGWSAGFDQWVSDVMADSFSGKLKGLTSCVSRMSVF